MTNISPELQRALESDCATGVEEVVDARNPADLSALRQILAQDSDVLPGMRQNAIQILGRWGDRESVTAIRALLPGFTERERINAADALGRIGGPESQEAVLGLSRDANQDVRRFAAYALARFGTEASRERLQEMELNDSAPPTRKAATRSLRR